MSGVRKGDVVCIQGRRRSVADAVVVSAGRKWIGVSTGERFNATPNADGSRYGEFGTYLWPSRQAYDLAVWATRARWQLADRLRTATPSELQAVCDALGFEVQS